MLLGCDEVCDEEATPLPEGRSWEQRVDEHVAEAFDGEQCSEGRPQAVRHGECEYASDPTVYVPEWLYFDRFRRQEEATLLASFTAFVGIFRDEYAGGPVDCTFDTAGEEDEFEWYAELSDARHDADWEWPGAARFNDAALLRSPKAESFPLTDGPGSYGWLCLEAVPPVDGFDHAGANWQGVMFLHSETREEGEPEDYMLLFH